MSLGPTRATNGRPHRAWLLSAVLLTTVGIASLLAWHEQGAPVEGHPTASAGAESRQVEQPDAVAAEHRRAAAARVPRRLNIASLGISTPLLRLGQQADRTVQVPENPDLAGWYRYGPPPGARGSAVILGHVDSLAGPAVFARLGEARAGTRIDVALRGGAVAEFVVTEVRSYPNADFPAQRVYARPGGRRLNLVTCGGTYDRDRGGYQANVVVYSRWLRTTHA